MSPEYEPPRFLFTYGTLMSSVDTELGRFERRLMSARAQLVGRGRVRGRLYDAGACPAGVASESARGYIHGEVWMLPVRAGRLLRALDRYEGCEPASPPPYPYRRTVALVTHELGWQIVAWAYVWNGPTRTLTRVRSGHWSPTVEAPYVPASCTRGPPRAATAVASKAA